MWWRRSSSSLALLCWPLAAASGLAACSVRMGGGDSNAIASELRCELSAQCPIAESPCLASMCLDGECVFVAAPQGALPPQEQVPGDCKHLYCNGNGEAQEYDSPADMPPEDENRCTEAACVSGSPEQAPRPVGAVCGEARMCSGNGHCGVCLPDKRRCEAQAVVRCDRTGQWQQTLACEGKQPLCSNAKCIGVQAVAAGNAHACARFDDGSLRCWGQDRTGWSQGGMPSERWASGYTQLAVGRGHTCGVRADGSVWCWGRNAFGQLGDGSLQFQAGPVRVPLQGPAAQVALGAGFSCARLRDGGVACWGRNDRGQLATGALQPLAGIASDGGGAASGQVVAKPKLISILSAAAIQLPGNALCVGAAAEPRCFGGLPRYTPSAAALPPPTTPPAPGAPGGTDPADADKAREARDKAIDARKQLVQVVPQAITGLSPVAELGCGERHCCVREQTGKVLCWGANGQQQLGAAGADRATALAVAGLKPAVALAVGATFSCVLHGDKTISCFGDNRSGQLGRPGGSGPALPLAGLAEVTQLQLGDDFGCVMGADASISCWGAIVAPNGPAGTIAKVSW